MKIDDFGDRMKAYEHVFRQSLPNRLPVIIRVDGCHFHSFTRGMEKPFDESLTGALWEACKYAAERMMGCKIVYQQSDEISILLTNYDTWATQSWFNNNVQKMASVSASMITAQFNEKIRKYRPDKELATFDSRVWVLPHDEVANYFIWRQQDCMKNSISMLAQAHFPQAELQGLSGKQLQDKLYTEKRISWDDLPVWKKHGICVTKQRYLKGEARRSKWEIDWETPIFSQNRDYIDRYVYLDRNE